MNPDVEEQFILRLPPELAEKMRSAIRKGKQDLGMELRMTDSKHGELRMGEQKHPLVVAELPTIVESQKTLNNSTYYKSADIHQMLVVLEPGQTLPKGSEPDLTMKHGLTPPTRNSRRRFVRHKQKINLLAVETELLKIMRRNALYDNGTERIELIDGSDYEDEVEHPDHTATEKDEDLASDDSDNKKKKKKQKAKEKSTKEADGKEKKRKKEKKKHSEAATPTATPATAAPRAIHTPAPTSPAVFHSTPISAPFSLPSNDFFTPHPIPVHAAAPTPVFVPEPEPAPAPLPLPLPLSQDSVVEVPELRLAQLQQQHRTLTAELSALHARKADSQAKASASPNLIMKMRYEAAISEVQAHITARTAQLAQITEEIRQLGGV